MDDKKRTCLVTNVWLYIVYVFLCYYLSVFATSRVDEKLIVKILIDYLLERNYMSRSQATILTNMCLIEDGHGNIVMQIRNPKRYSWSGAALPGGHIEAHEGLVESVIREVKEETGLTIRNPKLVGMKHWYTTDDERYLVFLYRTSDFEGDIHSTEEGEVRWVAREDVPNMDLAYDMLNLLRVFEEDQLSELFYRERLENDFIREFW